MTPEEAYRKCYNNNNKRDKDLEQIIIKSPQYATAYAIYVIQGRWIEAENIISTNPYYAYGYALHIIKGKLPENMHNAMLLHGLNADNDAKKYLEFLKIKSELNADDYAKKWLGWESNPHVFRIY